MTLKIQIIIAVALVFAIFLILNMVRKNKIDLRYALVWLAMLTLVLVLDAFPNVMGMAADFIGIDLPVNMLFFFGFCFLIVIVFSLSMTLSKMSYRVKKLTQELALLEEKLETLKEQKKSEKDNL